MNKNQELFEKAPVSKAVAVMAIPTMISMLVVVIYNMADTFFIGQTNDPMKVAAVSLATPIFMVFMALGNLFGIGGSSAISRALGEHKPEKAKHISAFCCYGSLGVGIFMAVVSILGMELILKLIGASENTIDYARDYLFFIALGAPFIMFGTAFGNILRGEGASRESMIGNLIGTIVNIVLDPIMILVLGWGVVGAAVATVIGNMAASLFYLGYFLRKRSSLSINIHDFKLGENIPFSVASIGIPASLNNILMSCANMVLNQMLASYGDTPVAAMGVATKVNMLVVLLQIGLCAGIQPLIGYNYGARNKDRIISTIKISIVYAVGMMLIGLCVLQIFPKQILNLFNASNELIIIGVPALKTISLSFIFAGFCVILGSVFQSLGNGVLSLMVSAFRQLVVLLPSAYLLSKTGNLNLVWFAFPISEMASVFLSYIGFRYVYKKEIKPLDDEYEIKSLNNKKEVSINNEANI